MKKIAKSLIVAILAGQVRRLRKRHNFKVVAVAGSIGKTSTKFAIANILGAGLRVRYQEGNYNDIVSVPLVYFGLPMPSLLNPVAWLVTVLKTEKQIRQKFPYDVVVIEVGTDFPGNIALFKKYVDADIGVLTAITPEHMEFFDSLHAVAQEELTIAELSQKLLVNADLCEDQYLSGLKDPITYGVHDQATYRLQNLSFANGGYDFVITKNGQPFLNEHHTSLAETQLYSITAGAAVADMLGLSAEVIRTGIETIKPVNGRMKHLAGIRGSQILDDTYNASPEATKAALDTLYKLPAAQKIALLGNMNELGTFSEEAHTEIGTYCDPQQLALVVTLGPDSNQYLAAAAEAKGCKVVRTQTPYEAADKIQEFMQDGALILAKGSQNKVYAEEAVKKLLANPEDVQHLVRQSDYWQERKRKVFGT